MDSKEYKNRVIKSAELAINELIKVIEDEIITGKKDEDLSPDRLKNAAATKKLAIMDCFEIIERVNEEKKKLESADSKEDDKKEEERPTRSKGFAERHASE